MISPVFLLRVMAFSEGGGLAGWVWTSRTVYRVEGRGFMGIPVPCTRLVMSL